MKLQVSQTDCWKRS